MIARARERLIWVHFYHPRRGPVLGDTHTSTADHRTPQQRYGMDIASDTDHSKEDRPGRLLALVQAVRGIVGRLFGFLALTEDERLRVGIYLGGMEQDR